ncbi:hypothetical protein ACFFQF_09915 [Haladaptatus pallidirubidus]|uniref:Uncharacterized protein n=1 Tax=Haladaptatus pallidirubidus TaxID=1008152 RepID=A0AAV3UFT0_9EURY|nr:hypothetical protein [Haladaptatus pallidirubidus]
MTNYSVHEPPFDGTTDDDWSAPQEHDFDTDDLSEIADHFVLSASGFDSPERYNDLKLPVVSPAGELNENALQTAYSGGHSVESIEGIDEETKSKAKDVLESLASEFGGLDLSD